MIIKTMQTIEQLRHGDHICLLYESQAEHLAALAPFHRDGLAAGDRCVHVASDTPTGAICDALRDAGVDVEREIERGAFLVFTPEEVYLRGGAFDPDAVIAFWQEAQQEAARAGFSGLHVTGDVTWALQDASSVERLGEYEAKVNEALLGSRMQAICCYNRQLLPAKVLAHMFRTHPRVVFGEEALYPDVLSSDKGSDEVKEHERRAAVILDGMYQFVALLNSRGDILEVNRAALEGAGHQIEDIRGKPFWTARWWQVSEQIQEELQIAIKRAAAGEFVRYEVDIYGEQSGAVPITIDFSLQPIWGESGEVEYLLPEGRNITERKRAEEQVARQAQELQVLNERLQELDRLKTQFFANVSHEFRTPLTLMLGPLRDILEEQAPPLSAGQRERLEVAYRNSLRLLKLVNSLLDFSRIEAGRMQATYEATNLAAFTRDLASAFRSLLERAGVRFSVGCQELSGPVYVDREKWEKVVFNLLSNAFKFTFQGEIEVSLSEEKGQAVLRVRDTGAGIPESELPHLFERFHRVEGAQGRSYEGTGIGLALVQELVHMHAGTIEAESREGHGSTFTVHLPLGTAHLSQDQVRSSAPLASTAIGSQAFLEEAARWLPDEAWQQPETVTTFSEAPSEPGEHSRVLLADDNADMRDYIRQLLEPDYAVEAVADGPAALEAVAQRMPDLVLADVMMPRMDGFELLRTLRSDPKTQTLPIILLSARAGEESRIEGIEAGADDYLIKPFSARELLARVGAMLLLAQVRQQAEAARAQLLAREREARNEAETLNEIARVLAGELDLQKLIQSVTDAGTKLTGAKFGAFFYNATDKRGESYLLYPLSGAPREAFEKFGISRNTPLFHPTFQGAGVVRSDDVLKHPKYGKMGPHYGMPRNHLPVRSYLAVPVTSRSGEVLGGLFFAHPEPGVFSERAERIGVGIAAQAAIAIDNAQLLAQREQSERRFREMIDALPAAIYTTDAEGYLTHFNPAAVEFSGRVPELGADQWCVSWKLYRADGTPLPHDECPMAIALKEGRVLRGVEAIAERPDGKRIWFNPYPTPLRDAAGRIVGGINMLVDITERKQAEEAKARLAAIVESAEDAIISKNLHSIITSWNRGAEQLFGYTAQEVMGQPVTILIPPDRLDEEPDILERIRRGESIEHYETVRRRKDGTLLDISLTVSPITDTHGQIVGASKIARDITERKQAEEALREADRQKDVFLAMLSHELRNPLAPISNGLQLLRYDQSNTTQQEILSVLDRQVGILARLIDDLLDVSRVTTGKIQLQQADVDLNALVQSAADSFHSQMAERRHEFSVWLSSASLWARADPTRLEQVVVNLLSNAAKYTPEGGRVWLTLAEDEGDAVIRVKDSGKGIEAGLLPHLFELFSQGESTLDRAQSGLGIGLALVKSLVEMHGGTITARSAGPGQGSEFIVRLPTMPSPEPPALPPQDSAGAAARSLRVLLVDDLADTRRLFGRLLEMLGNQVRTAHDGPSALEAALEFRPDVVILDIGLPGMNGYEVAQRMRQEPALQNVVLVAVTGYGWKSDRQRSQEAGFDHHLVKPPDINALQQLFAGLAGPGHPLPAHRE